MSSVGSAQLQTAGVGRPPPVSTVAFVALVIVAVAPGTLNVVALTGMLTSGLDRTHVATASGSVGRTSPARAVPHTQRARPEPARPSSESRVALRRFVGTHFAIDHPVGWRVETAEAPTGAYLDTTIRSASDRWVFLRVDVTPGHGGDPAAHAAEVERYLKPQQGYRRIDFRRTKLGSSKALYWEFTVVESGVRLRKVDVFLTDADGNRVAVLTQAPAEKHRAYMPLLERLRASFAPLA